MADVRKPISVRIVESTTLFKATVVAFVLCYLAQPVVVPFVIATLFAFLLQPLVNYFERRRVPHLLACALALLTSMAALSAIAMIAYAQFSGASLQFERWLARLRQFYVYLTSLLPVSEPGSLREPAFYLKPEFWTNLTMHAVSHLTVFVTTVLLIVFFAFFLLRDGPVMTERLVLASRNTRWPLTKELLRAITHRIHQYMTTVFLIESAMAACVGIVLWALGVPYAFLWALLSGVLSLIPFLGATIAAIPPVLITLAEYDGYGRAMAVLGFYVTLQLVDGKFITPLLVGKRVNLSPVVILLSTVFWGWMWGVVGLLLSTPLLVCLKVVAENIPALYPLSILMASTETGATAIPTRGAEPRTPTGEPDTELAPSPEPLRKSAVSASVSSRQRGVSTRQGPNYPESKTAPTL